VQSNCAKRSLQEIDEKKFDRLSKGIKPEKKRFTWVGLYKELAEKLLACRSRQADLVALLHEMAASGLPVISLQDKDDRGDTLRLEQIDPFTFFATFNRGITDENRSAIIEFIKSKFDLDADVPDDFDGIPVVNNMSTWFFPYKKDRSINDIDNLWSLAENAIKQIDIDKVLFDTCLKIGTVGTAKLTQGLFWLQPDKYLPFDSRTRAYLKSNGIAADRTDFYGYAATLAEVKGKLGTNFPQISYNAYKFTNMNDNQLLSEILEEDINAPFEEWQEKVSNRIMPFFARLHTLVAKANADRVGETIPYKRKAGDVVGNRECLTRWMWRLTSKKLPKARRISAFVQLGDIAGDEVIKWDSPIIVDSPKSC
jgi:hypothetical protein